jgi:hypothetical protein
LQGLAVVSATDVWAVGIQAGNPARVERWNGTAWALQRAPHVRGALNQASAVSAPSAGDVWIAGGYITLNNYSYRTLTEHLCPAGQN